MKRIILCLLPLLIVGCQSQQKEKKEEKKELEKRSDFMIRLGNIDKDSAFKQKELKQKKEKEKKAAIEKDQSDKKKGKGEN